MNFKIGDKVRFLNDVGGGVITAFINEKTVEVQNDDGFEIPVLATEILLDAAASASHGGGSSSRSSRNDAVSSQHDSGINFKTDDYKFKAFKGEVILAIVPENDALLHVSDLKLYLINDSDYSINYVVSQTEGGVYELVSVGTLEPDTKLHLKKYGQSGMAKIKEFRLQGNFYKQGLFEPQKAIDTKASIDGVSFYKANSFSENEYFDNRALVFKHKELNLEDAVNRLSESDILKVTRTKENRAKKVEIPKPVNSEIEEVDLHIEQIIDNHSGMSNGEIIEIQLGRFETSLETALKSKAKKVVFIHGVGSGRLKQEIAKKLDRKYSGLKYQDASFKEYGYGATMVYLK